MKEYRLFADILDYPMPSLAERIDELLSLVAAVDDAAGQLLARFREFAAETTTAKMEEVYSATFDLQPLCYPYVGYQMFGEEYRRGMFMARLREHYRSCGFAAGSDLPDHLCVILRFLSGREVGEVEHELVTECLVPALKKMEAGFAETTNPYRGLLQALILLFRERSGSDAARK
ncbi:nitrate reductase molybdenum cofactor assembly chaperone [Geobacter grbiciae]|uniref:nitrate reductase molybdenum cofactor assembly chaperone n=1 Tax=Geobacter grbiciae TaxID=155042 RepID=UPI001C00D831|nr:nitrate reductase molybdenum cofactor assembly chaperone [Geobacter grbiciae]MBT1074428.1 nitrate reductase molybdenum cofactor assembly chaperone [Geobacter grbiciae]